VVAQRRKVKRLQKARGKPKESKGGVLVAVEGRVVTLCGRGKSPTGFRGEGFYGQSRKGIRQEGSEDKTLKAIERVTKFGG